MPRYSIARPARDDLDEIWRYLAKQSGIDRAEQIVQEIHSAIVRLSAMPGMGHERDELPDESLRCWEVKSYIIIYRPRPRPIRIMRVVSGYRDLRGLSIPP